MVGRDSVEPDRTAGPFGKGSRSRWFPLVIDRTQRDTYIGALESADAGNLKDLVDLFADVQKKAFLKALSISDTIQRERESVQNVVGAALDRLRNRGLAVHEERSRVFAVAERLEKLTMHELEAIGADLADPAPLTLSSKPRRDAVFSQKAALHLAERRLRRNG
jgi:hypothetical protein